MRRALKKILLSVTASVGISLLIPASSFALAAQTNITGTVTNNGNPVAAANVVVVCNSNSRSDDTDTSGGYLVQFTAAECPSGKNATVVATKDNKGGTNSKTVTAQTSKLNVAIVNVALPEFGVVAGMGAAVIGGGAFMVIRKKQLEQN